MSLHKGTLYLSLAWSTSILAGYVINVWLSREFQPDIVGVYGLVMSILGWLQIMLVNSIPYTIQKFISANRERAHDIFWTAFPIQTAIAAVLFTVVYAAIPPLAGLFSDPGLKPLFRIAFIDLLIVGFFHLLASFQNGMSHFRKQAILYMSYSLSRIAFVILLVSVYRSIQYAFVANIAGSLVGTCIGFIYLGREKRQSRFSRSAMLQFMTPSLLYFMLLNLFFFIDFWFVKYYLSNQTSGYYFVSSLIAKVPYFFFLGLSAAVLPTVSYGLARNDMKAVKDTIRFAYRIIFMISTPLLLSVTIFSRELIILIYGERYSPAAGILQILIWGMTFLAFFSLLTTILNSDNRPRISLIIATIAVFMDIGCNMVLVPKYGAAGGAVSTTVSVGTACLLALVFVARRFPVFMPSRSFFAIAGALLFMVLVMIGSHLLGVPFVLVLLSGGSVYTAVLMTAGELKMKEVVRLIRG